MATDDRFYWAFALSAMLFEPKRHSPYHIYGYKRRFGRAPEAARMLETEYSIRPDAKAVRLQLESIVQHPCIDRYWSLLVALELMPESQRGAYCDHFPEDSYLRRQARFVLKYLGEFGAQGIFAWPAANAVYAIRHCILLGYIGKEDGIDMMLRIARQVQLSYSGWPDYAAAVVIGEQFYALYLEDAYTSRLRTSAADFLQRGAAQVLPWTITL